jgi:alanine or glycine:cation symporter, AGCS family
MKRIKSLLLFIFISQAAPMFSQVAEHGLDQKIDSFFKTYISEPINAVIFYTLTVEVGGDSYSIPYVLLWLIVGALFCTIYFRFVNFRQFKLAINIVRGKYDNPEEKGEVSHFQALTAALSGTVGLGNIGGVAVAVSLGGPGATFWMIVAGFLGMSSKFAECTLGVRYREIGADGTVYGGPMYYLKHGFKEKFNSNIGKYMAIFFAIACVFASFGGGNMYQSNQAYHQMVLMPGLGAMKGWLFGLIIAVFVGVVIIGGIKSIAKLTDKMVPAMVGIYLVASLVILGYHFTELPQAFGIILTSAFTAGAVKGGVLGALIQGFQRSAFSNEAGMGSSPIAHSAVKTDHPASEGVVSLLEPFIDTIIICTMTALVIVVTKQYGHYVDGGTAAGVKLTSASFASVLPWFPYILSVAVLLFAVSTMVSWSYYGAQAWSYLFGRNKLTDMLYKFIFCTFIIVGASSSLGAVIDFSDAALFAMCIPNFIGIYALASVVKFELSDYLAKIKSGKVKSVKD